MKKTFAILIAVVLVLSLAVNAVASGSQAIILGNAKFTEKGEEQVITIEAENLDSISVISLVLAYDSTKIELQNVVESEETGFTVGQVKGAAGSLVGDAYVCCPEKGIITIIWEKEKTVSGSGVIANLSFKALTADAGVQKIALATYGGDESYVCRDNALSIPVKIEDFEFIEAVAYTLGDVNGDENITMTDVMLIRRYLVNSSSYPLENPEAADINGDGNVTMTDVMLIRRYLVNSSLYPIG